MNTQPIVIGTLNAFHTITVVAESRDAAEVALHKAWAAHVEVAGGDPEYMRESIIAGRVEWLSMTSGAVAIR